MFCFVLSLRGGGVGGRATLNGGFYRIPPGEREDLQRYTKTDGSRGIWPWQGFPTASKLVTGMFRTCKFMMLPTASTYAYA